MSTLLYSFLLIPMLLTNAADTPLWEKLERLVWKNRVVLIYAPAEGSPEMRQQLQMLNNRTAGVRERDLVVIECVNPVLSSEDKNLLSRRFKHNLDGFGVWLIGKDGSVKLSSTQPVTTDRLFALIDTMPMRRTEQRNNH